MKSTKLLLNFLIAVLLVAALGIPAFSQEEMQAEPAAATEIAVEPAVAPEAAVEPVQAPEVIVVGEVVSVDAENATVSIQGMVDDQQVVTTLKTDASTMVLAGGMEMSLADLKTGDSVNAHYIVTQEGDKVISLLEKK